MKKHVLITTVSGTAFAGQLLDETEKTDWIGLKPGSQSGVIIYFHKNFIQSILLEDGGKKTYEPLVSGYLFQEESRIPVNNVLMVRVKGGVSYRGSEASAVQELQAEHGYWLKPSLHNGIVIYIPQQDVEKVFGG